MPDPNSPYAEVPVFPLISKQDANTLVKPKKDMQKQTMQRKKQPVASKVSRFSCKKKQVQEVRDMDGASATCNSTKGSLRTRLKTYVLFDQAAAKASAQNSKKKCSSGNNSEHPNKHLLKLWQKIHGAQIGRQSGSRRFYHTFSTYSWSWNACRELVTAEELQAHDWYCRFLPATRHPHSSDVSSC
uniref:Uncharacterized protein n=1 Tax=Coturnix japonica TaxID=93934 RepID=A0A8C2U8V5_COTJA